MRHRFRPLRVALAVGLIAAGTLVPPAVPAHATAVLPSFGYELVGYDGGVFAFSPGTFVGSLGDRRFPGKIVAALDRSVNATGQYSPGYLLISDKGVVYPFGLHTFGDLRGVQLNAPIVAAVAVSDGYLLVAADGGVFTFGRASFAGSLGGRTLPAPIVGIALTREQEGYWLVDAAGRVYPFGDARNYGDLSGATLDAPVVGIAENADADWTGAHDGYLLATANGVVVPFGAAWFHGDVSRLKLSAPVAGIEDVGQGYFLFAQDGGVFTFGPQFRGSMGGRHLNGPIAAMAVRVFSPPCKVPFC
jgi:hypothetical protein